MMRKKLTDIKVGDRFWRLVVIEVGIIGEIFSKGVRKVRCICECGNESTPKAVDLLQDNTRSCGCLRREATARRFSKHNESKTQLYILWCNIKGRCYSKSNPQYSVTSKRGIMVCDAWRYDYKTFKAWCIANGGGPRKLLRRVDNNKGFSPENCFFKDRPIVDNGGT